MLLSVLLLAATVQATPPSPSETLTPGELVTFHDSMDQVLQTIRTREACRASGLQLAESAPAVNPKVQRLGDLPPANHTLTVLRSVDGCPVSSTIRFNVDRPARR
jgi:hypothetical protein